MSRFNSSYYPRFYGKDGAHDAERIHHLASAVHHISAWWGLSISSVFDIGAGMGMWRDWYRDNHPEVVLRSIDVSEHACETWGHECRNIAEWKPRGKYDLVICHSVLQYLSNEECEDAIANIAAATRYVLYLELPTKWDFENVVDETGTDLQVYQRSATWYRKRLGEHFRQIGAGLWTPLNGLPMYELEAGR
jgi:trans-aconitate methyltransferase